MAARSPSALRAHEQHKARLAEQEAKLKTLRAGSVPAA